MEKIVSSSFKVVIALIAIVGVALFYLGAQSQSEWSTQTSPHQSLEEMKATGNIEVKSFEEWQRKHKGGGEAFKAWRASLHQGEAGEREAKGEGKVKGADTSEVGDGGAEERPKPRSEE